MNERRYERLAAAVAVVLLFFSGFVVWRSHRAAPPPHVREVRVAWRCATEDGGACSVVSEVERCTTCHTPSEHARFGALVGPHASIGCVACHGGDAAATEKKVAHAGLARLGANADVPEVEARCAACHVETRAASASPAREAWARWLAVRDGRTPREPSAASDTTELAPSLAAGRRAFRAMRCGACHVVTDATLGDATTIATPLDVLGLRATPSELARALQTHATRASVDLALDAAAASAVATHLAARASVDASTALQHRASVPGSSAEDGHVLYEKLACVACHDPSAPDERRIRVDLANVATTRTADWIAYYLGDPLHANAAATMPSLRLSQREASSLAAYLVRTRAPFDALDAQATTGRSESIACKLPSGETKTLAREACGAAIVSASKCAACHTTSLAPAAKSLAHFGELHDGPSALAALVDHAGFHLEGTVERDLATALLAQRDVRVRPDLRLGARTGEALFASLGCVGCHALDDVAVQKPGPSLFGEGLRARPQWLFELLRAPQRHAVRSPLHPEWAYRDLVPAERVAARMPTYAFDEHDATELVRFFATRDGASFPYAATPHVTLGGDALTSAIGDLTHKDRGACTSCHTIAIPDVARAREDSDKLAPPLALAHDRLRPEWIEACILQPEVWVAGMPPFARPLESIDRVRDLVMLLRERTELPTAGAEGNIPALGLGDWP